MVNAYYKNKGDITNCTFNLVDTQHSALTVHLSLSPNSPVCDFMLFVWVCVSVCVLCVIVGWSGIVYVNVLAF